MTQPTEGTPLSESHPSQQLGDILCELRREVGYSQKEMADLIGVDFEDICRLENGRSCSGDNELSEMAPFLGVPKELLILANKGQYLDAERAQRVAAEEREAELKKANGWFKPEETPREGEVLVIEIATSGKYNDRHVMGTYEKGKWWAEWVLISSRVVRWCYALPKEQNES